MFPKERFEARFREILALMDEALAFADDEDAEDFEEINAEFEDALFLLSETDMKDEDAVEQIADALEELDALCADYRRMAERVPGTAEPAERMDGLLRMAESALKGE